MARHTLVKWIGTVEAADADAAIKEAAKAVAKAASETTEDARDQRLG